MSPVRSLARPIQIGWGAWDSPLPGNPVTRLQSDGSVVVQAGDLQREVSPAAIADLNGSHQYAMVSGADMQGHGSGGPIAGVTAAFDVNFNSGLISNGLLQVNTVQQHWNVEFTGNVHQGIADLHATSAQLFNGLELVSELVNASVGGVFTGNAGETFVGAFELLDATNPANFVNGLFVMER